MAFAPEWQAAAAAQFSSAVAPRAVRVSIPETGQVVSGLLAPRKRFGDLASTAAYGSFIMANSKPPGEVFARRQRLLQPAEFQRIFDNGRRSRDRYFTVLFCENDLTHARLGLAISRRRVRRAAARNRLKRLVRESFRCATPSLPALDIVVMAGSEAPAATNQELFASLASHWSGIAPRSGKH